MAKKVYTIQENGQITLPQWFRKRYGLEKGDTVIYKETEEGLLISVTEMVAMKLLEEIGEALEEKGITLEEMIESGREIRQEIYNERYARDLDD